jgi:hypothetical protein
MNTKKYTLAIPILMMILAVSGCGSGQTLSPISTPTSTNTPIPPTATPTNTPIPPTPTITAIPGSNEPVVIGDFNFKISTVDLTDKGYYGLVPYPMTPDQTVLVVEVTLISGDLGNLSKLEVWVTDEQGNQTNLGTALSIDSKNQVVWLFPVAKTGHSFFLHFSTGEVIDLSSLLPNAISTPLQTAAPAVLSSALTTWNEIPIMPGATTGLESGGGYAFFTNASQTEITTYYEQELAKLGWTLVPDPTQLNFTKGSSFLNIMVSASGDEYLVAIGLAK